VILFLFALNFQNQKNLNYGYYFFKRPLLKYLDYIKTQVMEDFFKVSAFYEELHQK